MTRVWRNEITMHANPSLPKLLVIERANHTYNNASTNLRPLILELVHWLKYQ